MFRRWACFLIVFLEKKLQLKHPFLQAATPQFPVPVEEVTGGHSLSSFINKAIRKQRAFGSDWCPVPSSPASLAWSCAGFTYSFLGLLLGGACLLRLLDDSIEGKTEPCHAGKITDVDIKIQPLLPHRLRAHVHFRAWHHFAQHLIAVKETCLHHQLRGEEVREYRESMGIWPVHKRPMTRRGTGQGIQSCE